MPACTPVPTIKVTWSNKTLPFGDFIDAGTEYEPTKQKRDASSSVTDISDVTKRLFDGLVADGGACAATSGNCDSTKSLVFDNVATTSGEGVDFYKVTVVVDDSSFVDQGKLYEMLVSGLTMWALVASRNCQTISYKADADDTESGCGQGPVQKRSTLQLFSALELQGLEKRSPISPGSDGNIQSGHMQCTYEAQICSAPNSFRKSLVSILSMSSLLRRK